MIRWLIAIKQRAMAWLRRLWGGAPATTTNVGSTKGFAGTAARFDAMVNKMTNHENHLWARAGWPGLRHNDIAELLPYARGAQRRLPGNFLVLADRSEGAT